MNGRPSDEADPPATEAAGRAAEAEKTPEGSPSEGTPGKRETLCANLFGHASGACSWQRDRPSAGPPARRSARGDLVHDFVVENEGTVPLVVTRVFTSCSCLKASYSKRPIPPGGTGVIRITYEPYKSEPGTFYKVIQVYSNSTEGRTVITVQGSSYDDEEEE